MLASNPDPGSSWVEIGQAEENAILATARFFSVQVDRVVVLLESW
jgi:hypothetical protein